MPPHPYGVQHSARRLAHSLRICQQKLPCPIRAAMQSTGIRLVALYEDHLSTPRPLTDRDGNPIGRSSRVEFVKSREIGGRTWIHSRHFESEVPGFYTDYFATGDQHIAILVTFSAHRSVFDKTFARFFPSMATIRPLPFR